MIPASSIRLLELICPVYNCLTGCAPAASPHGFELRQGLRQKVDSRPVLVQQWHPTRNGLRKPSDLSVASNEGPWWLCAACPCGHAHEWPATVQNRVYRDAGCPVCAGRRPCACSSLAALRPAIAADWDPEGNDDLKPEDVTVHSSRAARWVCKKHEQPFTWTASVSSRTNKHKPSGCPECARAARRGPQQSEQPPWCSTKVQCCTLST